MKRGDGARKVGAASGTGRGGGGRETNARAFPALIGRKHALRARTDTHILGHTHLGKAVLLTSVPPPSCNAPPLLLCPSSQSIKKDIL